MRITVKAWKQVLDYEHLELDEESIQNLKLGKKHTWTQTQIVIDDILEHYEYKTATGTSTKTVIEFTDGRPRMIIKETFLEFTARLKVLEDLARLKYAIEDDGDYEEEEEDEPEEDEEK